MYICEFYEWYVNRGQQKGHNRSLKNKSNKQSCNTCFLGHFISIVMFIWLYDVNPLDVGGGEVNGRPNNVKF